MEHKKNAFVVLIRGAVSAGRIYYGIFPKEEDYWQEI